MIVSNEPTPPVTTTNDYLIVDTTLAGRGVPQTGSELGRLEFTLIFIWFIVTMLIFVLLY